MKTRTRTPRIATIDGCERRTYTSTLEARDGTGLEFRLEGWASVVDQAYDMGSYDEVIARGAFQDSLAKRPDVQLLVNHEDLPLARTTIPPGQPGHLSLSEDYRGLHVSAQLDRNDPDAVTLVNKIRSGLLDQMSFAFKVTKQTWSDDGSLRTIQAVDIDRGDVSVVNFGASPTTSVDARSRGQRDAGNLNYYRLLAQASAGGAMPRTMAALAAARSRRRTGLPLSTAQAWQRTLQLHNEAGRRR